MSLSCIRIHSLSIERDQRRCSANEPITTVYGDKSSSPPNLQRGPTNERFFSEQTILHRKKQPAFHDISTFSAHFELPGAGLGTKPPWRPKAITSPPLGPALILPTPCTSGMGPGMPLATIFCFRISWG
jgi:hypothetical protein